MALAALLLARLQARDAVVVAPLILSLLIVFWLAKNRFHGCLNLVPGPFASSLTVLPRLISVYKSQSHLEDLELHKKYGKIVRVAPNTVSVTDTAYIDTIYGITSKFYKGSFYDPVRFHDEEGLIPDPFILTDKAMHSRVKRSAANAYSLQALIRLEPLVDKVISNLITRLDENYVAKGQICDISLYMLFFSMVSTSILVGFRPFLEHRD